MVMVALCPNRCIVKALRSTLLDPESASCLSAQLLRRGARGRGKCLHQRMTRKWSTLAAEDYEIISFSPRPAICSFRAASIPVRSSSMFRVVSRRKIERILGLLSICRLAAGSCAHRTAMDVVMTCALSVLNGLLPHPCDPRIRTP